MCTQEKTLDPKSTQNRHNDLDERFLAKDAHIFGFRSQWTILNDLFNQFISYLCEVADNVCYQESIENILFIITRVTLCTCEPPNSS